MDSMHHAMKYEWSTAYKEHVEIVNALIGRLRPGENDCSGYPVVEATGVAIQNNGMDCGIMVAKNIQTICCPSLGQTIVQPDLCALYRSKIALSFLKNTIIL